MAQKKTIYLTGYEKENIGDFIIKLKSNHITQLVDVREIPLSRKNGFSRDMLKKELEQSGIKYIHLQKLGSPKSIREDLKQSGNYITFFNKYRTYVKSKHYELQKIISLTQHETICVMCFEKDCELCHRTIVADEILKKKPDIRVIPI